MGYDLVIFDPPPAQCNGVEYEDVAAIVLNRYDKYNALNTEMLDQLYEILTMIANDLSIRAVVKTSVGIHSCSGADIEELVRKDGDVYKKQTEEKAREHVELGNKVANAIENLPQPVICTIKGYTFGGGLEMALAADIRLAADNALIGLPETWMAGCKASWGGPERLAAKVGPQIAKDLSYLSGPGNYINAQTAYDRGLVLRIFPLADITQRAFEYAAEVAKRAPIAIRNTKEAINIVSKKGLEEGLKQGAELGIESVRTEDTVHGATEFKKRNYTKRNYVGK